jgi:hypothetical protein
MPAMITGFTGSSQRSRGIGMDPLLDIQEIGTLNMGVSENLGYPENCSFTRENDD